MRGIDKNPGTGTDKKQKVRETHSFTLPLSPTTKLILHHNFPQV